MLAADEETPLLAQDSDEIHEVGSRTARTPLPWRQFSILLLLQLVEPLTSQVIAPFLPQVRELPSQSAKSHELSFLQLVREIGITHGNESQVGYYVGLVVSPPTHVLAQSHSEHLKAFIVLHH